MRDSLDFTEGTACIVALAPDSNPPFLQLYLSTTLGYHEAYSGDNLQVGMGFLAPGLVTSSWGV